MTRSGTIKSTSFKLDIVHEKEECCRPFTREQCYKSISIPTLFYAEFCFKGLLRLIGVHKHIRDTHFQTLKHPKISFFEMTKTKYPQTRTHTHTKKTHLETSQN